MVQNTSENQRYPLITPWCIYLMGVVWTNVLHFGSLHTAEVISKVLKLIFESNQIMFENEKNVF
jgi:hypothetical protein